MRNRAYGYTSEQKRVKNELVIEKEAEVENQWWTERENRQRYYEKMFSEREMLQSGGPVQLRKKGIHKDKNKDDSAEEKAENSNDEDNKENEELPKQRPVLSPARFARRKDRVHESILKEAIDLDTKTSKLWVADVDSATDANAWIALAHEGPVVGVGFSADESQVVSVGAGAETKPKGSIRTWTFPAGEELRCVRREHGFNSFDLSPDRSRIALGTGVGTVEIYVAD